MKHFFLIFTLMMVLVAGSLPAEAQASSDFVPVTDSMLQNPDPADWLMWRRTLDSWGYSPLDQVDRANVDELRMVWSRALGPGRSARVHTIRSSSTLSRSTWSSGL